MAIWNSVVRLFKAESGQLLGVGLVIALVMGLIWTRSIPHFNDRIFRVLAISMLAIVVAGSVWRGIRFAASGRTLRSAIADRPKVTVLTAVEWLFYVAWAVGLGWPSLFGTDRSTLTAGFSIGAATTGLWLRTERERHVMAEAKASEVG
jgi:hypothetical protein